MPAAMPLKLARLLAVIVALVVPLQGMASVMAGQCMAFGHHDAPMSHAEAAAHDGHDHEHEADQPAEPQSSHCGPCAACCGSASMASPSLSFGAVSTAADAAYVLAVLPPARLAPGELDRPPLAL
jgi:hypothetical protein